MNYLKKIISILTIVLFIALQNPLAYAQETPTPPPAPEAPAPAEPAPSPPAPPTAPSSSTQSSPAPAPTERPQRPQRDDQPAVQTETAPASSASSPSPSPFSSVSPSPSSASVNPADALTQTGAQTPLITSSQTETNGTNTPHRDSAINAGNGAYSQNSAEISNSSGSSTTQTNSAEVGNKVEASTTTGGNGASQNVGDTAIKTGDANVTGTAITTLNSNASNVMVSEFNVTDNHNGDLVLDFEANCISGCAASSSQAVNAGNGADSSNSANINNSSAQNSFQYNDAAVGNLLKLSADSGNNVASENTNGDSTISTGDANVAANSLTLANNNVAGQIVYGVVNIFGTLNGDIILPESEVNGGGSAQTAVNSGNGAGSANNASTNSENTQNTFQSNSADIQNDLVLATNTGNNQTNENTGGDSSTATGDSNIQAKVLNVANSNVEGNWWLVLVNKAGKWVGKIVGAPEGSDMAGSEGTEFVVNDKGEVTAVNSGNGADSENSAQVNNESNSTVSQSNNAKIKNKLDLSANTGSNKANENTLGDSTIQTGDANIIASIVNFVNNNIVKGGKLVVTVVNVFGEWNGNFILPGQKKEEKSQNQQVAAQGASQNQPSPSPSPQPPQSSNAQTQSQPAYFTYPKNLYSYYSQRSGAILGISGNYPAGSNGISTQVAGFKAENDPFTLSADGLIAGDGGSSNVIQVNLAWLLVILPSLTLAVLTGKKLFAVYKALKN